jgi:hypothetical protein
MAGMLSTSTPSSTFIGSDSYGHILRGWRASLCIVKAKQTDGAVEGFIRRPGLKDATSEADESVRKKID